MTELQFLEDLNASLSEALEGDADWGLVLRALTDAVRERIDELEENTPRKNPMTPIFIDFASAYTAENFYAAVKGSWRVHNDTTIDGAVRGRRLKRLANAIMAGIPERRPDTRFSVAVAADLLEVAQEMLNFSLDVSRRIEPTHPDYHLCIFEGDIIIGRQA